MAFVFLKHHNPASCLSLVSQGSQPTTLITHTGKKIYAIQPRHFMDDHGDPC